VVVLEFDLRWGQRFWLAPPMKLIRFDKIQPFWETTQLYLCRNLAEHNLLLGVTQRLLQRSAPEQVYLAAVLKETEVVAVALQTPPYKLLLSKAATLEALPLIAADYASFAVNPPGVNGLVPELAAFLPAWEELTGQTYRRVMTMTIHKLTAVNPISMPAGKLRLAVAADRSLLIQWSRDFAAEIGEAVQLDPETFVDGGIKGSNLYLWQDDNGRPVSFAGGGQIFNLFARVGPVYTPPADRRQGYASACVASMSQRFLDQGCQQCFLFTDQTNPTSNHIYQMIGYQPLCDWHDYGFDHPTQVAA
jgi:uncharacterized protein